MLFVRLKDFDQRPDPDQSAQAITQRANDRFRGHRAGRVTFMQPPPIQGRVQTKLETAFPWTSDSGELKVYAGARPA